ncbi:hypothetical protein BpHYR1_005924 [Brachionus plicatilis]|uniref:Uncharacterized protein n=1 Tax=Brachionus plicatilis TaxID=10195 RepID=A0A3M7S2X2_BRAPC|nr:hypothetical protein BpHYR1_005924 [Brachionus plicatilis]
MDRSEARAQHIKNGYLIVGRGVKSKRKKNLSREKKKTLKEEFLFNLYLNFTILKKNCICYSVSKYIQLMLRILKNHLLFYHFLENFNLISAREGRRAVWNGNYPAFQPRLVIKKVRKNLKLDELDVALQIQVPGYMSKLVKGCPCGWNLEMIRKKKFSKKLIVMSSLNIEIKYFLTLLSY